MTAIDPWIETVSGIQFEFLNPKPDMISINDIANALGNACRYTGQIKPFYSVAEHAVAVSYLVPQHLALEGLMHDASEAYIADVASPVKQFLSNYKEMEDVIMHAVAKKYGFNYPLSKEVKYADLCMLSTEAYDLLPSKGKTWNMWDHIKRPAYTEGKPALCLPPEEAKQLFLKRFEELYNAT